MQHKAISVLSERTVYGEYAFVDGYHVIFENSDRGNPVIIRFSTLETVKEPRKESDQ